MKKRIFLLLLLMLPLLSACASPPSKVYSSSEESVASQQSLDAQETQAASVELPSREAVFIYGNAKDLPAQIILRLGGAPLLLLSGYVRLVGIVAGENPAALVEVGGKGLALEVGDDFEGYQLSSIAQGKVVLRKKGK
jgi:hypothetical protein